MGIIHSKNYSIRKKLFNKIFIQKIWKLFIQNNYSFFWKIDYRPGLAGGGNRGGNRGGRAEEQKKEVTMTMLQFSTDNRSLKLFYFSQLICNCVGALGKKLQCNENSQDWSGKVEKQQRPKHFALLVSRQHRCVQRSTGKLSALFFTRTVNRQSGSVTADISNLSLVSNLLFLQTMTDIVWLLISLYILNHLVLCVDWLNKFFNIQRGFG